MKFLSILFCFVIGYPKTGFSQNLKLPANPYIVIIDKYKIETSTIIEANPIYSGVDSLRLGTYFYKNEKYTIKYPTRIDTFLVTRSEPPYETSQEIEITDHFDIMKLVDSISMDQLNKLLEAKIEIYQGSNKMKVTRIGVMLIWNDGNKFETNFQKQRIGDEQSINIKAKSLSPNGYLILDGIWFTDSENKANGISGYIGWKIL